jgi:hypothetical protein
MRIEARDLVSRGSSDRQTAQSQPIIGTPCDVPEPSTRTLAIEAGGFGAVFADVFRLKEG